MMGRYHTDSEGYLCRYSDWNEKFATACAKEDGVNLIADHFLIISIYRDYYDEYQIAPSIRVAAKIIKNKHHCDAYLEKLFTHSENKSNPRSLNHRIIKYSGLPKPTYYDF